MLKHLAVVMMASALLAALLIAAFTQVHHINSPEFCSNPHAVCEH